MAIDKPILIFPQATISTRSKRKITPPTLVTPTKDSQVHSFNERMSELDRVFANQTVRFAPNIEGLLPEMVLVFEIAGSIDEFFKAVEKTQGMEYLMEYQGEFLDEGSGFFFRNANGDIIESEIEKRIFVTLTNQRGITELLSYWQAYRYGQELPYGTAKFRSLFSQLRDIRPYNIQDRLRDTGFEKYLEDMASIGITSMKFEIELVFHENENHRNSIIAELNNEIAEIGGEIINESVSVIPSIKYFGLIADAPIAVFNDLTLNTEVAFLQSQRVLFFKPVGQSIARGINRDGEDIIDDAVLNAEATLEQPIVALLDGMPIENHQKLNGKLIVDDHDNFSNNYPAAHRCHGTSMASLILHGNLDSPTTIKSKLYVRPILQLVNDGLGGFVEKLPEDKLTVDLIHRAVTKMFEGNNPTAPQVKIINFSIGDEYRPFLRTISTWAKLLDYLSYKYKILFIISTGNYEERIELPYTTEQFEALTDNQKKKVFYKSLFEKNFERKILTPSESINGLTIGGLHLDGSVMPNRVGIYNPCITNDLPCVYSRIGYGFNRSLKPEVIFDSGRSIFRISGNNVNGIELSTIDGFANRPPGIKVAIPGQAGSLNSLGFTVGTSNAAALISNKACKLYEILENINELQLEAGAQIIPKEYYSVLLKTLLVHYAENDLVKKSLTEMIVGVPHITDKIIKEYVYQNTGYGILNKESLGICTEKKVTVIGYGKLKKDEGHIYKFPLPNELSGNKIKKRLTISLGWLSPVNFISGKYKMAQFFFDNIKASQTDLFLDRAGADFNISRRGTIQHDVLSNESADVYIEGSELAVKVNCKESASGLKTREHKHEVEYGLAVTLQAYTDLNINIYEDIRTKLMQRVRIVR